MANGLRIWYIDKKTGETIHLGGEFTWGDCEHVTNIFQQLIAMDVLPKDGRYATDVQAQFIWLSAGAPWFEDPIVPLFSKQMIVILDAFHLLEKAADFSTKFLRIAKKQQIGFAYSESLLPQKMTSKIVVFK